MSWKNNAPSRRAVRSLCRAASWLCRGGATALTLAARWLCRALSSVRLDVGSLCGDTRWLCRGGATAFALAALFCLSSCHSSRHAQSEKYESLSTSQLANLSRIFSANFTLSDTLDIYVRDTAANILDKSPRTRIVRHSTTTTRVNDSTHTTDTTKWRYIEFDKDDYTVDRANLSPSLSSVYFFICFVLFVILVATTKKP